MEGQIAVPLHFAAEFFVLAVMVGAALDSVRRRRVARALGFVSLAAAQALHGSLALPAETSLAILWLRGAGFALLFMGISPIGIRPASPAATSPALLFAGRNAPWSAIPAALAAVAAFRSGRASRGRHDVEAVRFAAALGAFAVAELAVTAARGSSGWFAFAHVARVGGGSALVWSLWPAWRRSVRTRLVATFVAALLIVVLIVSLALNGVIVRELRNQEFARLDSAGRAGVGRLDARAQDAAVLARGFASSPLLQSVGPDNAEDYARALLQFALQQDFLLITSPSGKVLGSAIRAGVRREPESPMPGSQALAVAGSSVVREALARARPVGSAESVRGSDVYLIGAAPIEDDNSRLIGALVMGTKVSGLLRELADGSASSVSLVVGGRVQASTLDPSAASVDRSFVPLREEISRIRELGKSLSVTSSFRGRHYLTGLVPIKRQDGLTVGLVAFSRPEQILASPQRAINRRLFLVLVAVSLFAAAIAWLTGSRVARPITVLTGAAEALRRGNLAARASIDGGDEFGVLGQTFNEMAGSLQRTTGDLRSAAVRIETIVQSMDDALIATDSQDQIVTFNRAAERIVGRDAEGVIGRNLAEVIRGRTDDGRSIARSILDGDGGVSTLERPDGTTVPVALTSAPLKGDGGKPVGRVAVMRDVSREREVERMKSEFLANVSHELRTPLTPIRGYADILKRKRFSKAKERSFLDAIEQSSERLERIVEILIDYAAIEGGRLTPGAKPVAVRPLLQDVAARWRGRSPRHRFTLRVASVIPQVAADAKRLDRILDELVDNAAKFSPEGGPITITAARERNAFGPGRDGVRIDVRDRGIGIEPEKVQSLFLEFHQLDASETRTYGGLGLGLAYAQRVATALGGRVSAESAPGQGSTFTVVLPVAGSARRRLASQKKRAGRAR